jgi:glycosyltransferase involved in cell wall biosynthesis
LVKKQFPKATLEIYGRDWFFPDGSSYIQMLKNKELPQLGAIANEIHFHGVISFTDIPSKYAEAEVCVFPSHMETLGLVAPEAMAMQKPVVFTNKGPGTEIIIDGKTGLLCNPHSPEDIADKIIWMLAHKEEAKQMGTEARKDVLERFDIGILVQKNIRFYEQIIQV